MVYRLSALAFRLLRVTVTWDTALAAFTRSLEIEEDIWLKASAKAVVRSTIPVAARTAFFLLSIISHLIFLLIRIILSIRNGKMM